MLGNTAELLIIAKARDEASGMLQGLSNKMGGLGGIATIGFAAVAAGAVAAGAALFKVGSDFDAAYDAIRIGTGATGEAFAGLKDDMRATMGAVPASMEDVGTAIADLNTRLGLTGAPLQAMSAQMLELSRITKTDVAENIRQATRVFGDWGVATKDQASTLDMLFRTSQATGIGIGELQAKIVQYGAPLRAMGFGLQESAAMLGKWEKEGVNSELVLGSLRIAMGKFAKENVPMREGLMDTVKQIQEMGPSAAATAMAMEVFGARAGPDMAAAILEGRFAYADLLAAIEGGSDTIVGVGKETMDAAEKFDMLKNRAMVLIEPLASGLFDALGSLVDVLLSAGPAWDSLMTSMAPVADFIKGFASGTGELPGPLADVSAMIQENVVPAIRELWANIEDFLADLERLWGPALANVQALIQAFMTIVSAWWDRHGKDILAIIQGLWTMVQGIFQVAFAIIGGVVKTFLALLGGNFDEAGDALQEMWAGVWVGVQKIFQGAFTAIFGILRTYITTFGEIGAEIGRALWDALTNALAQIKIDVGPFHLSSSGFRIDTPEMPSFSIPGFASGGTVPGAIGRPMLAVVHGGETIIPQGGNNSTSITFAMNGVSFADRTDIDYFIQQASAKIGGRSNLQARFGGLA